MNPVPLFLIIVTLPLLLGGCREKPTVEPVAEAKPEVEGVNVEELERREDIAYLKGSDNPYTGKGYGLYKNGQKKSEGNWKNGKLHGLITEWYENGQKKTQGHFKDGKEDGLQTSWYESGQKKDEVNGKDGKADGLWVLWHENGQKRFQGNFNDGKEIIAKYWNSKGEEVDSLEEAEAE